MKLKHSKAVSKEFFIPSFYLMLVRVAAAQPRLLDFFRQAFSGSIQYKLMKNKTSNNLKTSFKVVAVCSFESYLRFVRKIPTNNFFLGKNKWEKN